jgi:hypothetical protein
MDPAINELRGFITPGKFAPDMDIKCHDHSTLYSGSRPAGANDFPPLAGEAIGLAMINLNKIGRLLSMI